MGKDVHSPEQSASKQGNQRLPVDKQSKMKGEIAFLLQATAGNTLPHIEGGGGGVSLLCSKQEIHCSYRYVNLDLLETLHNVRTHVCHKKWSNMHQLSIFIIIILYSIIMHHYFNNIKHYYNIENVNVN